MPRKRSVPLADVLWGAAAIAIVVLQFWWLPGEHGVSTDSWSATVDGKLGLFRTLSGLFPSVKRDFAQLVPDESATLLLIAPDRYPTRQEESALHNFVARGGTLLFAPNWGTEPCLLPQLGIQINPYTALTRLARQTAPGAPPTATPPPAGQPTQSSTEPETPVSPELETPAQAEQETPAPAEAETRTVEDNMTLPKDETGIAPRGGPSTPVNAVSNADHGLFHTSKTVTSPLVDSSVIWRTAADLAPPPARFDHQVLVTSADGEPEVIAWNLARGTIVCCSSPDVFSNRAVLEKAPRRLAVRLVEYCHDAHDAAHAQQELPVVLGEYLNASESWRHAAVLLSPALRIGTLQLVLLAVLGGWYGFHRFGPARQVPSAQRRNLTDSAIAVGNLQSRLSDGGPVIHQYLEYVTHQLRRRYGRSLRLDDADDLAPHCGLPADRLRSQLARADDLQNSRAVSPAHTAGCIRWLARLKQRLVDKSGSGSDNIEELAAEDSWHAAGRNPAN